MKSSHLPTVKHQTSLSAVIELKVENWGQEEGQRKYFETIAAIVLSDMGSMNYRLLDLTVSYAG